jgi:hypothetical protein
MCLSLFTGSLLAGEWVLPWMANRDGQFASEIAINNHGSETATVNLQAVRTDGSHEMVEVEVPGATQQVFNPGMLFQTLGSGSGYSVFMTSESENLSAAVRVASVATASGFSAAMGEAVLMEHSSDQLAFPLVPANGFAGLVLVNVTDTPINVSIAAYTQQGVTGEPVTLEISPRTPFSQLVSGESGLFPDLVEDAYLLVKGDGAMVGAEFYFNELVEPAMINAQTQVDVDASLLNPLLATLETAATINQSMDTSINSLTNTKRAQMTCPEANINVNITKPESLIEGNLDWGTGCTNRFGVFHAGVITLNFERQGSLLEGSWMSGRLAFEQFQTRYLGSNSIIDGATSVQADTDSKNFSWTGSWDIAAEAPIYGTTGSLTSNVAFIVNGVNDQLIGSGSLSVRINAVYNSDIEAFIDPANPLVYQFEDCIWPTSGRIDFEVDYAGFKYRGWLDFNTGNCNTATLSLRGIETELYLPGIYETP